MKSIKQPPCHASSAPRGKRLNFILWLTFAVWCITLFILSSIPNYRFPQPPFSWADKAVHTLIFATGAFLLGCAAKRTFHFASWKGAVLIFVTMVLIGVGDEFHQTFTPGRSGNDRGDLLADALGALLGLGCAALLHGKRPPKTDLATPLGNSAT
ncbi:MAG: VanZ family protein [Chthoniobacterales bacterium]